MIIARNIPSVYYGVVATYEHPFSAQDKDAINPNMLVMAMVKNGAVTFAYRKMPGATFSMTP